MSFFKDLRSDFSKAVDDLILEEGTETLEEQEQMVNTLDSEDTSVDSEKMKEILDEFTEEVSYNDESPKNEDKSGENNMPEDKLKDTDKEEVFDGIDEEAEVENMEDIDQMDDIGDSDEIGELEDEIMEMDEDMKDNKIEHTNSFDEDHVTVITKGTTIEGNVSSEGSLEVMGVITGDIKCKGKLSITGKVQGESEASEIYINTERLEGSVKSEGSVKVGLGSVIVGDITATSGVIAGAVKGEIDINGPVVVDSTAIIVGNIKAQSIQINNGAVIEGFCSLSYSEVDVENIFE